jgi:hypothetical protein
LYTNIKSLKLNDHIKEIVLELTTLKSAYPYERALWENYRKQKTKVPLPNKRKKKEPPQV